MKKITQEEFERRIKARFPEESFTVLKYDSTAQPATLKCDKCGEEINVSKANNFLAPTKAYGCKNCHGLWKAREEKLVAVKERYNILETYVKETHTYYRVECKQCHHVRDTTLNNLFKHLECGCITGVKRNKTAEEFIQQVNEHSCDGTYTLVSEYVNQTTKVLLRHDSCGFIWSVRPSDVLNGRQRCPKCGRKESKGAKFVESQLRELNIPFDKEHQLEGSLQRFDFYIETSSGQKIAIEYNGAQHYEENNYFSRSLKEQQELDERKRQYCKNHNITLIEISYKLSEEEISALLKEQVQRLVMNDVESSDSK